MLCITSLPNWSTTSADCETAAGGSGSRQKQATLSLSAGEGGSKAGGDSGAVGGSGSGSGSGSFAAHGCRGQVLEKGIIFAKTLSFRLSFCYRFGLRFSYEYVFLYVETSMQCDKKRTTRRAGSKWKLSNCWLYKTYNDVYMQMNIYTYIYIW